MFITQSHEAHGEQWLFPSPGERSSHQCLTCIIEVLRDKSISTVQRGVALGLLKNMVGCMENLPETLIGNLNICIGTLNLILDIYTKEPFKKMSVCLCANLMDKLQSETVFNMLVERINTIIHGDASNEDLHFYLSVYHQLSEKSMDNVKMLFFCSDQTIANIINASNHLDQKATTELAHILKFIVRMLQQTVPLEDQCENPLLLRVVDALTLWFGTSGYELRVACLALLSECVKSTTMVRGLLTWGGSDDPVLLMGLKRLLATKDDTLILMGTQCLTGLMEAITDHSLIQHIFDTDLAEFVFECLHSSNVYQLNCVFHCLHTMACHQLFFEKCHAVYGLETTLSAVHVAMDTKKYSVVEKGLAFLTTLLHKQPEIMPLFVNQTWQTCASLLQNLMQHHSQTAFLTTLTAVEVFLRPKHQQSPVDVGTLQHLLRTVKMASESHLQQPMTPNDTNDNIGNVLKCFFSVMTSMHELMQSNGFECGNDENSLCELWMTVKSMGIECLLPWTVMHWQCLSDKGLVQEFFTFLDIASRMTDNNRELMQVAPMKLLHQGLILLSQPFVQPTVQNVGIHILLGILEKYIDHVKPKLQISLQSLRGGFSRVPWHVASLDKLVERANNTEERGAIFILIYLSLLQGYGIADSASLLQCLKATVHACPEIFLEEAFVVRSFIYTLAVCQANTMGTVEDIVFGEKGSSYLDGLTHLPVDSWYTSGPAVFSWALFTTHKAHILGRNMVEYWLMHLEFPAAGEFLHIETLTDHDLAILTAIVPSPTFLHCLMDQLQSDNLGTKARIVLEYCITQLSESREREVVASVLTSLIASGTQRFETLFVQSTELDFVSTKNVLLVLCKLLASPAGACLDNQHIACFKSVYHVVKLINKCCDQEPLMTTALQFCSQMVKGLSSQESKTVIPVVLQDKTCATQLERILEDLTNLSFPHALAIVVWLAVHGQHYEANNFVTVKSELLLQYLTSCSQTCCHLVLQLLRVALLAMYGGHTMYGACHFIKTSRSFVPLKIFSLPELRQMYWYLQQFLCQEDSSLRQEASGCIQALVVARPEIEAVIMQNPWNMTTFESFLSKAQNGLQESDLDLCTLYSKWKHPNLWSSATAQAFLIALLNSSLAILDRGKAILLVDQIKDSQVRIDIGLLDTVVSSLQEYDE